LLPAVASVQLVTVLPKLPLDEISW